VQKGFEFNLFDYILTEKVFFKGKSIILIYSYQMTRCATSIPQKHLYR